MRHFDNGELREALVDSAGLTKDSIRAALVGLLGRPIPECRAVHIPTAAYPFQNGPLFATQMADYWAELGWRELGTLELTAIPSLDEQHWLPTLQASDAILVAGGNTGTSATGSMSPDSPAGCPSCSITPCTSESQRAAS